MRSGGSVYLALFFSLAACGPSAGGGAGGGDGEPPPGVGDPCQAGETRCTGSSYQVCENGSYVEADSCPDSMVCDPDLGCAECLSSQSRTCVGNDVYACNSDGTLGGMLQTCGDQTCSGGVCASGDGCSADAELVYVVDEQNGLWSFDPRKLPGDPFESIGTLSCPAGSALPEADPLQGQAQPFSMSVDRDATAWVLYSSGELFEVSTDDASCQPTNFQVGQKGFKLFGMGFVSDQPGSDAETLYISGGDGPDAGAGDLGKVDMGGLAVSMVGALGSAEYSPELTGTGDAELFGYFPGQQQSFVAKIDKGSAQNVDTWQLPALSDQVAAWAFAHWGGHFYIFVTTTDAFGFSTTANVLELDPDTGQVDTVLSDTGKVIVGAGVSTCAPVVVN